VPDTAAQPVTQPTVQFFEFAVNTCHTEVIHSTPLNFIEFFDSFAKTHGRGFPGDGFELLLQLFPTLF
jgi:hypothetical protein